MIQDIWHLRIYFDVGYKEYTYYDFNQMVNDFSYDLWAYLMMSNRVEIRRELKFIEE